VSVATEITKATVSPIFLLEATAGFHLRGWVTHSANASKITFSDHLSGTVNAPTAVHVDGVAYTEVGTIGDVEAASGRWAYISGVLYIRVSGSLQAKAIVATIPFYFSNKPRITNGDKYYDPRIETAPALSIRIEPRFSGVGQVGSGSCRLSNHDSFFDDVGRKLLWDYGTAIFRMGVDSNAGEMAYADFVRVGTWKIERAELTDKGFTLSLKELKSNLDREIPFETYSQTDYPLLDKSDVGKVIPRAYGKIFGAKPVCLDPGTKRFKLAGHAIYDILEVRIRDENDVWQTINPASRTLADAEFTIGSDWENGTDVSVDFIGKKLSDGKPMYNPSDIVQDILTYIGESAFSGFTAAFNEFDLGLQDDGIRRTVMKPSLYIDSATKALEVIGQINEVCGTFLYVNANGQWHYAKATPVPLGSITYQFTERDIREDSFTDESDASKLFSKVTCKYARRTQDNFVQTVSRTRAINRYGHSPNAETLNEIEAPLWDEQDAIYYAERLLTTEGVPLVRYRFEVPWSGFLLTPGTNVQLVYTPKSLNTVVEIIEVRLDLVGGRTALVAIDRRGWGDSMGFWVADSQPAWSAGDSDATKLENRQTSGFWTGDDNLAISADGKSFETSRLL
jgi:hypothetical protein